MHSTKSAAPRPITKALRPRPIDVATESNSPADVRRLRDSWRSAAASVTIAFFLMASFAGLVPDSRTSEAIDRYVGPAVGATGLRQNWGVFAPEPTQTEVQVHAVVYFEDGTSVEWTPRTLGVFDSSRAERWRKWESRIRLDEAEALWPASSTYIADQFAAAASPVARVRLVRTWSDVPPPTEPNDTRELNEFHFYEWNPLTGTGQALLEFDQLTAANRP